jgi:hypothetical protein
MRIPIHFSRWFRPLALVIGMAPRWCHVDVGTDAVDVQMSWAFRTRLLRSAIASVAEAPIAAWRGVGVHGWGGTWAVNGSLQRTVEVRLSEPARARVMGVPVRLRRLLLSVEDPAALVTALRAPAPVGG